MRITNEWLAEAAEDIRPQEAYQHKQPLTLEARLILDLWESRLELATIERLLMPHTVGGSEFVGDPKRCAEAVVESLKRVVRYKQKAQEKHAAELALLTSPTEAEATARENAAKAKRWDEYLAQYDASCAAKEAADGNQCQ